LGEGWGDDRGDRGECQENFQSNLFWMSRANALDIQAEYISVTFCLGGDRL
jgi:hypothetical protein